MAFKIKSFRLPEEHCKYVERLARNNDESEGYIIQQGIYMLADSRKEKLTQPQRKDRGDEE